MFFSSSSWLAVQLLCISEIQPGGGEFLVTEALAHKRETLNSLPSTHVKSQAQCHIVCDPGDREIEIGDP